MKTVVATGPIHASARSCSSGQRSPRPSSKALSVAAEPADAAPAGAAAQPKPAAAAPETRKRGRRKGDPRHGRRVRQGLQCRPTPRRSAPSGRRTPSTPTNRASPSTAAPRSKRYTPTCSSSIRGAIMTVKIESIRFLGPDIAVEKGIARVKSPGGLPTRRHVTPWSTPNATASGPWFSGGTPPTCRPRTRIT